MYSPFAGGTAYVGFRGPDSEDQLRLRSIYNSSKPHQHTTTSGRDEQRAANAAASAEERQAAQEAAAGVSPAAEGTAPVLMRHFDFPKIANLCQMFEMWGREIAPRDAKYGSTWRSQGLTAGDAKSQQNKYSNWLVLIEEREHLMRSGITAEEALTVLEDDLAKWKAEFRAAKGLPPILDVRGKGWTDWGQKCVRLRVRARDDDVPTPQRKRPSASRTRRTKAKRAKKAAADQAAAAAAAEEATGSEASV